MGKKRKSVPEAAIEPVATDKPSATFSTNNGRPWTLSVALPGSIIANAQSRELQAFLAGQIARALAVFEVDEVIVFDDGKQLTREHSGSAVEKTPDRAYSGFTQPNHFLAHILSYLECPPYLRRTLFGMHPDLQHTGSLPSLDMPHHLKKTDWCAYREGVIREDGHGTAIVYTGLEKQIQVVPAVDVEPATRLTLRFTNTDGVQSVDGLPSSLTAAAVHPAVPREESGLYWGYNVRAAASISAVLEECPFDDGYDYSVGFSERGQALSELYSSTEITGQKESKDEQPKFNHFLLAFGGVAGLEAAVRADAKLEAMGVTDPQQMFDAWVNFLPHQGSRTIRTEEAVWLGLMGMRDFVQSRGTD